MLSEIPFYLKGKIYRSPMPFGGYDPEGTSFNEFKAKNISTVVMLAPRKECLEESGKDLSTLYTDAGLDVIELPIVDYGIPDKDDFEEVIVRVHHLAQAGSNVVVHCLASRGRTGFFLACMAKKYLGLGGGQAIKLIREYIPGAVETEEQNKMVLEL